MSDDVQIRTPTYRVPRQRGMDPATRRLALVAIVLGGALVAVMGAWSLVGGHHWSRMASTDGAVPVIQPPPGPLRIKPANPGGMQLSAAEQDLFGGQDGDGSQGKLAPPPEVPDPSALSPPPPPPAPKPVTSVPPVPPTEPAAATPAAPAPVAASPTTPAPPAAPKPAAPPASTPAPAGHVFVQLAALPTEQAAKGEWGRLQHRMPDLLKDRQVAVSSADVNGQTWWRVRTGGFADPAAGKAFCDQVRAKGGSCDVAKF